MILSRYLVREALKASAVIVIGLFVIYLSMRFATALGEAAEGKVAPHHILRIVSLKMLVSLQDLLPMALLLGTFAAVTRLTQGSEWVAMRAAGISHQQLVLRTLLMSGAVAAVVALITLLLGPQAEFKLRELREQTENEATIAGVKAGRFRELGARRVFYAEAISPDERYLLNAFVRTSSGSDDGALRARRAYVDSDAGGGDRFAVFEDGTSYTGQPGRLDYVVTRFERYGVRIENREPTPFNQHIGFLPTGELLKREGGAYAIEVQWRMALPLCTLMGPVLALLIGLASRRGAWYLGLTITVAAYFTYTNLLGAGRALLRQELLPQPLGLWPIHLAFALALSALLWWQRRLTGLRARPRQELLRA